MNFRSAFKIVTIASFTAFSIAACGSTNSPTHPTSDTGSTTGGGMSTGATTGGTGAGTTTGDPNGGWTLSPLSPEVSATVNGTATQLQYVVYNPNTFQIAAYSYDYFAQAEKGGWNSYPLGNFSYFAVTLAAAPKAGDDLMAGTGVQDANSALGYQFTAQGNKCTASDYLTVTGGDLKITNVSADGKTVSGTYNLTIKSSYKSDSGTVTGSFTSGSVQNAGAGVAGTDTSTSCISAQ